MPTTICHGRSGETSSASIVPDSFSRVSDSAVISADVIVSTIAMRPGTNRFALSRVGLKRMRTCGTMRTPLGAPLGAALGMPLGAPRRAAS